MRALEDRVLVRVVLEVKVIVTDLSPELPEVRLVDRVILDLAGHRFAHQESH